MIATICNVADVAFAALQCQGTVDLIAGNPKDKLVG